MKRFLAISIMLVIFISSNVYADAPWRQPSQCVSNGCPTSACHASMVAGWPQTDYELVSHSYGFPVANCPRCSNQIYTVTDTWKNTTHEYWYVSCNSCGSWYTTFHDHVTYDYSYYTECIGCGYPNEG